MMRDLPAKRHRWTLKGFIFKHFKAHPWQDPEIITEANRRSAEIRELQHQARLIEHERNVAKEQYKLAKLRDEITFYQEERQAPEPPQNDLSQLLPLLMLLGRKDQGQMSMEDFAPLLQSSSQRQNPSQVIPSSSAKSPPDTSLSDDEIIATIDKIPPKYLKMAKQFPDKIIKSYAQKHFDFNEPTLERAIEIIRSR